MFYYELLIQIVPIITSVIALIVAIRANNLTKNLFKSTYRPRLIMYVRGFQIDELLYSIILKNHGQTPATIIKFECDLDWSKIVVKENEIPFSSITGMTLLPNQNIYTLVDTEKLRELVNDWYKIHTSPLIFNVHVEYYSDDFPETVFKEVIKVNLTYDKDMRHSKYDLYFKEG